ELALRVCAGDCLRPAALRRLGRTGVPRLAAISGGRTGVVARVFLADPDFHSYRRFQLAGRFVWLPLWRAATAVAPGARRGGGGDPLRRRTFRRLLLFPLRHPLRFHLRLVRDGVLRLWRRYDSRIPPLRAGVRIIPDP